MHRSRIPTLIAFVLINAIGFPATTTDLVGAYEGASPTGFEENKGQVRTADGQVATFVRFRLSADGTSIFLLDQGLAFQFERMHAPEAHPAVRDVDLSDQRGRHSTDEGTKTIRTETFRMDMLLEGADRQARISTEGRSADHTNYYGQDALDVHTYTRVTYHGVYPGIDWVIHTTPKGIKYDFIVHPGADPDRIQLRFVHHEELYLDSVGRLVHGNRLGRFVEERPLALQGEEEVPARFHLNGDLLSFSLGEYDHDRTLVIDPDRVWGTYYGHNGQDEGYSCAVDANGNVYLAGTTFSPNTIASGGHQMTLSGTSDSFLVKFNSAGVREWATYYGGTGSEDEPACALDASGYVYLTGTTSSEEAIAVNGHQNTYGGGLRDLYIVKFTATGQRVWGSYYGGEGDDYHEDLAVDANGNVLVTGTTSSTTGIAYQGHRNDPSLSFLVKLTPGGTRLWATYYAGEAANCAVDANGNVFLCGTVDDNDPTIAYQGHQMDHADEFEGYLVKFNAAGVRLWGTFYGGNNEDMGRVCVADVAGNVYLAGPTRSSNNIAFNGQQMTPQSINDAYVVKFDAAGVRQWGTYYGGPDWETFNDAAVDQAGDLLLVGATYSLSGIAADGFQNEYGGSADAFLVKFNAAGTPQWGSYCGGVTNDYGYGCAVDPAGRAFMCGYTTSTINIASPGAHDQSFAGTIVNNYDAFLVGYVNPPSTTSVEEVELHVPRIHPNPARTAFTLHNLTASAQVELIDATGAVVRRWSEVNEHTVFGVEEFPAGAYVVRINEQGKVRSAALVLE